MAEDDRATRVSLSRALEMEGYRVGAVDDGAQALGAITSQRPDAAILDVMMPELDGLSLCRALRSQGLDIPVLMLTARCEVPDRISGLDAGADDYMAKPFALGELLARLRALLRRAGTTDSDEELVAGDLRLTPHGRRVWQAGREITLTKTEFDLLELLMRNPGVVLEPTTIYERIWGYDFGPSSKNLAVYIGYLRRKLGTGGPGAPSIVTVRGVGYVLRTA